MGPAEMGVSRRPGTVGSSPEGFDYLEIWHNWQRRHSSLGMLTPLEFDNASTVA